MKERIMEPLSGPVRGAVTIPGSKSYTNRALVLAAMTPQSVRVERPLASDDTRAMLGCLRALGIAVREEPDAWVVEGDIRDVRPGNYELDADLSGITIRFLTALSAALPGTQTIGGKEGLNKRPI
ncbi:MAG TPA: 3-phosphoshikimate 1-carboxyvinyltransferase, partial [Candidatus Saccharimonadia bacterium]|nr:3-phosphoshikimate 1-carboxyvinyltransferase [Candidatus Saccharimonadia bacterium]